MKKTTIFLTTLLLFFFANNSFSQTFPDTWELQGAHTTNGAALFTALSVTAPGPNPAGLDTAVIPTTTGRLTSPVLVDIDNDGDLDMVSGSQDPAGRLYYFENTGTATTPNWVQTALATLDAVFITGPGGNNETHCQFVDIDNDGDYDLFYGSRYSNSVSSASNFDDIHYYENTGTATVPNFVAATIPGILNQDLGNFPTFAFVDLDNDLDFDLVSMSSDSVTYLKNVGTKTMPSFERKYNLENPWDLDTGGGILERNWPHNDVLTTQTNFVDVDKDGDFDMVFGNDSGTFSWIENIGTASAPDYGTYARQNLTGDLATADIGSFSSMSLGDVNGDGALDAIAGGFNPGYFAWFKGVNAGPSLTTTDASVIAGTSATLGGDVTSDNGSTVTERGIVYAVTATNSSPLISGSGVTKDTNGSGTGVFSESITGLTSNTQYSYRAYAINGDGTSYGAVKTFTTLAGSIISVNDPSVAEGASGNTTLTYTVSLSQAAPVGGASVDYVVTAGTATAGTDFTAIGTTTLSFAAGETSKTIDVTVVGDAIVEADETITITLSNPTGTNVLIGDATGTATITNDDSAAVTIADISGNENNGNITVTATLDNAVQGGFTVDVSSADGTATTADSDYTAVTSETLTFTGTAGETQTFTITPTADTKLEANETISITQGNLAGTTLSVGITDGATITITNDDNAAVTIEDVSGNENDGAITVTATLDNPVDGGFTVDMSSANGTATTADSDYTAVTSQTLTFAGTAGETQTFTITPTADTKFEANETISITQGNLAGTTFGVGITDGATVTITNDDNATVTIADVSGNENNGNITVTATLDNAVQGGFTVDVSSADGTATTADSDYTAVSSETLTFVGTAGETQTFTITPTADTKVEVDESLTISQGNLANTTLNIGITDEATVTITNDDTAEITVNSSGTVIVNEDDGTALITLNVNNAVQGGFSVDVVLGDLTATIADGDYTTPTSSTVNFVGNANETQTLSVSIGVDTKVEAQEFIDVSLSNLLFGTAGTGGIDIASVGSTIIINNDDSAIVTIADVSGNEDDGNITVTVVLDKAVDGGFDVDVSTADGTATIADSDYTAVTAQTLTFAGTAGEMKTFTVTPTTDGTSEGNETLTIGMSGLSPTTAASADIDVTDGATVTILGDDASSITVNDPTITEGNSGNVTLQYTVSLSATQPSAVTVDVATSDGTAEAGSDYTAIGTTTLTFNPGDLTKTVDVTVSGDTMLEGNETLTLTLSNVTGPGVISDATGTGTITNDDSAAVTIADVSGNENDGNITVTATLDNAVQGGFTVDMSSANGTATTVDSDYTAVTSETLTFTGTAGETQTFTITPTSDTKVEANETVTVNQGNLALTTLGVVITDGATVTLTNDDTAVITIEDVMANEDDGAMTLTATLDNAVDGGFTVNINFTDGTATTADSDYTTSSPVVLTFAGNAAETQTFTVTPTVDTKLEADETLFIGLSNLIAPNVDNLDVSTSDGANVTILNDDSAAVTINDVTVNEADGTATVTLTLDNAVQGGFTVDLSSTDGTAEVADSDYVAQTSTTSTFAGTAGETQTVVFTITDDTKVETDETFSVAMSNLAATTLTTIDISDGATVTITNDDSAAVTIADVSGNEDDGTITMTATLDNAVQGGFTVDVNTLDATATVADSDYTAVTGQILTFTGTAGETQTFTVTPTTDTKVEADEIVTIGMTTVDNTPSFGDITITDTATLTINNDDSTEVTIEDITVVEADGTASITATLSNPVQGGFDLHITTVDGTAVSATDYSAFADQLGATFAGTAGETQTLSIPITDDMIGEEIEDFTVTLSSVANTTLGSSITTTDSAVITITDDDAPVVTMVSVPTDGTYGIGDNLDFTVTFTNPANVTGSPSIPLTIGTATVQATLNGTFTNSLTADFRYTIVEDDVDTDGIAVGAAINLNGGTILGNTNIPAILDLNNVGATANVNVDGIKPTVTITSTVADPTNAAFTATFTFSEAVTGFDVTDITVGNGTAAAVTAVSTTVYTSTITPTTDGNVTIDVAADVAQDAVGNNNVAATQYSVLYDATNPTATMTTTAPDPTNTPFTVDIVFDEPVTGFVMADLSVTNGTPSDFMATSTTVYSALITPTATGDVTVDIAASSAQDAATNGNNAATFTIEYDETPPNPPMVTHVSDYTCVGDTSMTGDNTLEVSGIAEEGSEVEVFENGVSIGVTTTTDAGFFTFDHTGTVLADGTYNFTVTATDIAGNTSALSAPLTITIDSVDTDGDGLPDFCDDDDDGNGVTDTEEDCDGDGIIDSLDTDNSSCNNAIAETKQYGFSPNGDGVNDGWFIENITAYPNSLVQVFNRSGKVVFKKKGYQNDWDGISNQISSSGSDTRLPVGPYLFIIDLGNGTKPTKGWIYINY